MKTFLNSKIPWVLFISLALSIAIPSHSAQGATYYVKPAGNDANSGLSEALAWQHVQKGLATAIAGDTVFIRSGTYSENAGTSASLGGVDDGFRPHNSGSAGNEIVFKGYPGDPLPMILGINNSSADAGRMVSDLSSRSYIVFDSLHFRYGWRGINGNLTKYVTIRYCVIDSIMGTYDNNGGFTCYSNITNGTDVEYITIENCDISWVGKGGSWSTEQTSGIHMYACANMTYRNNVIHHVFSGINMKNGGFGGGTPSTNIQMYGNTIHNCYQGIRLGGGTVYYNTVVRNNVFYGNSAAGIGLGFPANTSWGITGVNTLIYNNTFDGSGTGGGIVSQMGFFDSTFIFNNIMYNTGITDYSLAIGFKNENASPTNLYDDYNMFYGRSDHYYYNWNGYTNHYTLAQWIALGLSNLYPGYATHNIETNPLFTNAASHDYRLQAGSPALTGGRGGAWPTYRGALAAAGLTVNLTARPTCLPTGGGTDTLTWTSTNADSVVIRNQATSQRVSGSGPANGAALVTMTVATTYIATAYKLPNTSTAQVTVTTGCNPPPTVTLTANPTSLPAGGGTSTLNWSSANADSVVIRDQNNARIAGSGPTSGSTSVSLSSTSTYTATAYKVPNTATAQATVTVGVLPPPTVTLTGNPTSLPVGGGTSTLNWSSANADSVVIRDQTNARVAGSGPTSGSTSVSLSSTSTYTATAYKAPNTATAQVTVTVAVAGNDNTAPAAITLAISNTILDPVRQDVTLRWTAPGDDGSTGTANRYDLRYSTSLINSDASFNAATQVAGEPTPRTAGNVDSMTVPNLDPNQVYYFALKTGDEVPNWSTLSNMVHSENRAVGRTATVSGTYAGYTVAPLTDGVIAPRSSAATWASDQSTQPHWVEIDFGATRPVNGVRIYWAWNSARSAWMVSQQYTIQRWNGSAYVDVVTVNNPTATDSFTVTVFPTVNAQRMRIYQPGNMGPALYQTIMWQTEIKIEYDTIPPAKVNDLGALPDDDGSEATVTRSAVNVMYHMEFAVIADRRGFLLPT